MEKEINGKAIYSPKGAAREYGCIGCNFYTGCPHRCSYCYLKRGVLSNTLGGTEVRLKSSFRDEDHALAVFKQEVNNNLEACRQHGIFFSFTTDPLIEETRVLTFSAMASAISFGVPVYVLTKDADFIESAAGKWWLDQLLAEPALVHFGFTLTGRDDMEPGAPSNHERTQALRRVKEMGFKTFASIEPVIDWESAGFMVFDTLGWCDHYKIGLRSGVPRDVYDPFNTLSSAQRIVSHITEAGATVYLKHSLVDFLRKSASIPKSDVETLLSFTVDMEGRPYHIAFTADGSRQV